MSTTTVIAGDSAVEAPTSRAVAWKLMRRPLWCFSVLLLMVAVVSLGGLVCAKPLLFVEGGSPQADVIVVLGGDSGDRVFRALELYRANAAPKILISGDGDCFFIRDRFVRSGVSTSALFLEPRSRNTKENAEFAMRIIRKEKMRKAIVVTSWYHSRRALACFRHFGKGMEFSSYPAYHSLSMNHKPEYCEISCVFREYAGLAWYAIRYGIGPYLI